MDAAVQAGNSGGPIYDEYGNVVGVVIAVTSAITGCVVSVLPPPVSVPPAVSVSETCVSLIFAWRLGDCRCLVRS